MNWASGKACLTASSTHCCKPPASNHQSSDRVMLTGILRLRGGALQTNPPSGNPELRHQGKPTTTPHPAHHPSTAKLPLQHWILLVSFPHCRARCPNNQTPAMSADPSQRLIVLVLLYRLWVLLSSFCFLFIIPPPLLLLLFTENLFIFLTGCHHEFHVEWLSACLIPNLTPGHELQEKHMRYLTPCVQLCLYVWCIIDGICKKLPKVSKHLLANLNGNITHSRD